MGNPENIPPELAEYLQILDIIWRLHKRQFDYPNNQAIINHLMLVYGFKRPKATQLVKDSLKYFYAENNQDNAVNKGILADNGMKSFVLAISSRILTGSALFALLIAFTIIIVAS